MYTEYRESYTYICIHTQERSHIYMMIISSSNIHLFIYRWIYTKEIYYIYICVCVCKKVCMYVWYLRERFKVCTIYFSEKLWWGTMNDLTPWIDCNGLIFHYTERCANPVDFPPIDQPIQLLTAAGTTQLIKISQRRV